MHVKNGAAFQVISIIIVIAFTWNQVVWAAGGELLEIKDPQALSATPADLQNSQNIAANIVATRNDIESFSPESDPEFHDSRGRVLKGVLRSADKDGAIAYEYEYQPGCSDAVLKTRKAYLNADFTGLVATYEYEWNDVRPGSDEW